MKRILVIEDEPSMRLGISHLLTSSGYSVETCDDGPSGMTAAEQGIFDVVITDLKLPHGDGLTVLKHVRAVSPETGVIITTGYADVKTAVQAIKDGAFDYIAKPFSTEELLITIDRFLKFRSIETELRRLKSSIEESSGFENMIGVSDAMRNIFDRISSVAATDVPVLIQGESGTGKELVANAIHNLSRRRDHACVKINCAAIPESLFESELFGHERGAYTGAAEARKGKFELADRGSIFFDEIAEMPLSLQAKLLRVIEDKAVTRLGGSRPKTIDTRCLFASSRNIRELVKSGRFREDLYYRIHVVPIVIPPLRDRREDIPGLIEFFVRQFSQTFAKAHLSISPPALEALLNHDYPGNVRELKHALEHAVLMSRNGIIDIRDLPEEVNESVAVTADAPPNMPALHEQVASVERTSIIEVLRETGGRKIDAARRLGISRKVLWKKMREHRISATDYQDS